jgi:hypothetical protein
MQWLAGHLSLVAKLVLRVPSPLQAGQKPVKVKRVFSVLQMVLIQVRNSETLDRV